MISTFRKTSEYIFTQSLNNLYEILLLRLQLEQGTSFLASQTIKLAADISILFLADNKSFSDNFLSFEDSSLSHSIDSLTFI